MKNYFEEYYKRYEDLKSDLKSKYNLEINGNISNETNLKAVLSKDYQSINNLVMAGLGLGTLYLRMSAVLMISIKTSKPQTEQDVSFLKVIAEKLIHKLPADGDWLEIWKKYLEKEKKNDWNKILEKSNLKNIHELFVSFRNNIVHQTLVIKSDLNDTEFEEIKKGLEILDAMTLFREIFQFSSIEEENDEVYFYDINRIKQQVSPFVQINKGQQKESITENLPYLFQGNYYKGVKFISAKGGETEGEKDKKIEENFDKIKKGIVGFNGDKVFDFKEKIENYNEWCIGRDEEVKAILAWVNSAESNKNVLPIYAPAGMGKGALVAEVIKQLKNKEKVLYHFCGAGAANNLQAILYHFILQGKNYWNKNALSEKFKNRLERLPSQYTDVIELFQALITNSKTESKIIEINISDLKKSIKEAEKNSKKVKPLISKYKELVEYLIVKAGETDNQLISELIDLLNNSINILKQNNEYQESFYKRLFELHSAFVKNKINSDLLSHIEEKHRPELSDLNKNIPNIVIIIDGLDEAFVSDQSKRISDWFYTYDDKGNRLEKWISPDHIKWIFTYRHSDENEKLGYQFEAYEFNTFELKAVQPLEGLTIEDVKNALKEEFKDFKPQLSEEFIQEIINKGAVL